MHIGDGQKLFHAVAGEFLLVLLNGIEADIIDIVDGCSKTVGSHVVGCACFELKGQALKGSLFPCHLVNHLATTLIGRQLLKPLLLAIEHANARWAVHLMTTEGKEVAVHSLYVYTEVGRTLGTIHQDGNVVLVSNFDNVCNGIHRSQNIADMSDAQ